MTPDTVILSLGGSIVAPQEVDTGFLEGFRRTLLAWLDAQAGRRAILIVGGGAPARVYQQAYRKLDPAGSDDQADWIGIAATRLNAALVRALFAAECPDEVVTDPTAPFEFRGRILVGAGWKPGFSSDYDAVLLAERFGGRRVLNLSNIAQVYTADPKLDPGARPLEQVGWAEFRALVGDTWTPGKNVPFDPIATRRAAELGLEVVCAAGRDLANLRLILDGQPFFGTRIGPS